MKMGAHHVGIFTQNPERLIRYYTQGLGFVGGETRTLPSELSEAIFAIQAECQLTKLTRDGAVIEIFSTLNFSLDVRSKKTAGYNHWALEVEDKDAFVRILEERKVPVTRIDHQGRLIYFISDPDGNLIEIYQSK